MFKLICLLVVLGIGLVALLVLFLGLEINKDDFSIDPYEVDE